MQFDVNIETKFDLGLIPIRSEIRGYLRDKVFGLAKPYPGTS